MNIVTRYSQVVSHFITATGLDKKTTMDYKKRSLIKVSIEGDETVNDFVERLMGKKPEERMMFIQENALSEVDLDI